MGGATITLSTYLRREDTDGMGRWGMPVAVVAAVGLMAAFAFFVGPGRPGRGCEQPSWELAASAAAAGQAVVISADEGTACDPVYGWHAKIQISLYDEQLYPIQVLEAPMTSGGAFSADLVIPSDLPPGQYMVSAYPQHRSTCDDTNAMTTDAHVVRTACALQTKTLTVLAEE